MKHILILCTANSARSILAESLLNRLGGNRLTAHSAGSKPRGEPNPDGLALLAELGHDTSGLRSKSWAEFAEPGAPSMDIVITVCDNAANEACPIWPGAPVQAHWGIADPAGKGETAAERRAAFLDAYRLLEMRANALLALPFEQMPAGELRTALNAIGALDGATEQARAAAA